MSGGSRLINLINDYARLKYEYGAVSIAEIIEETDKFLQEQVDKMAALPICPELAAKEPDCLLEIKKLRNPAGSDRKLWTAFDAVKYADRLKGSLYGRMAGCTLGAPVESWAVEEMEDWAKWIGDEFPNKHYWSKAKNPNTLRYCISPCHAFTTEGMDGVPVDDDIMYTLLGLLIAENYGLNFKSVDVGKCWTKYLPYAYGGEEITRVNLKNGISTDKCGIVGNPFHQTIGASIRSDPLGYLAPGLPEKAAEMAYYDAYVSHRRNGIYDAMVFSAAIAAAFATNDPLEAIHKGLREIPTESSLYKDMMWALDIKKTVKDYRRARQLVDDRFEGMSCVHANNNAALVIFGLQLGGGDFTKTIANTVAMGLDNDCTGATAGSLWGAAYGFGGIDKIWYDKFNNKIHSYLIALPSFEIDDVLNRFEKLAQKNFR
jgi:ADP-ribosylglycohydrolase